MLEVHDRTAALTPGGTGRVKVDIRALSSLYTGFATAAQLRHAGKLAGATDDDIVTLADAFRTPTPFMREYF